MRKAINMNYSNSEEVQYNEAEILKINADGSVDANVFFVEDAQIIRKDNNLTFPADTFQLTEDELKEFFPDGIPVFEAIETVPKLSIEERLTLTEEATDEIINVLNEKNIL